MSTMSFCTPFSRHSNSCFHQQRAHLLLWLHVQPLPVKTFSLDLIVLYPSLITAPNQPFSFVQCVVGLWNVCPRSDWNVISVLVLTLHCHVTREPPWRCVPSFATCHRSLTTATAVRLSYAPTHTQTLPGWPSITRHGGSRGGGEGGDGMRAGLECGSSCAVQYVTYHATYSTRHGLPEVCESCLHGEHAIRWVMCSQ